MPLASSRQPEASANELGFSGSHKPRDADNLSAADREARIPYPAVDGIETIRPQRLDGWILPDVRVEPVHLPADHFLYELIVRNVADQVRGDDRPVAKHRHSVAKTPHLVQAVGNIKQAPALLFHAVNQREQPLAFLLVQRRRRLIEQQRSRLAAERADDFDDLLLGPAEPGDRHIDIDGDAKLCKVFYGLAPHLRLSEQSFAA